jgi:hypothetical protein
MCLPGLFLPCSWLNPPDLIRCLRLLLFIYNCSLPVLMCSLTNNLVGPSPGVSWNEPPYFYLDLFHFIFSRTLPPKKAHTHCLSFEASLSLSSSVFRICFYFHNSPSFWGPNAHFSTLLSNNFYLKQMCFGMGRRVLGWQYSNIWKAPRFL